MTLLRNTLRELKPKSGDKNEDIGDLCGVAKDILIDKYPHNNKKKIIFFQEKNSNFNNKNKKFNNKNKKFNNLRIRIHKPLWVALANTTFGSTCNHSRCVSSFLGFVFVL